MLLQKAQQKIEVKKQSSILDLEFEKNKGRSLRLGGGLRRVRGLRGGPRGRGLGSFGDRRSGLRGRSGLGSGGLGGGGRRRQRLEGAEWEEMQCTTTHRPPKRF